MSFTTISAYIIDHLRGDARPFDVDLQTMLLLIIIIKTTETLVCRAAFNCVRIIFRNSVVGG